MAIPPHIEPYGRLIAAGMAVAGAVGLVVNHFLPGSQSVARLLILNAGLPAPINVQVVGVNTMKRKGKVKRSRYVTGRRTDQKRAVVTLAAGDSIEIFETK